MVQAGILAAASMIVRIIGLLYRAPLTAIIGDEGNGYYGYAYNIYTIILMVSSYSIPSAISKLIAQKLALGQYRNAQRVFRCALCYSLLVGTGGSLLLLFGAGRLVPPLAVSVLRVFAPTVFLFAILGCLRGYFQARGSMVQTSVSQILEQIANAVVSIGAAWLLMRGASNLGSTVQAQRGAMGSALGTGSGVLIALLFMLWCYLGYRKTAKRQVAEDVTGQADPFGRVFKETILVITPFILSGFILNLTTSLNQTIYADVMIGARHMDQTEVTTLYGIFSNKAVVITNIPISIATAVAAAIIPGISAAYARKNLEETRQRAERAVRITAVIAIPSAAGLIALAKPLTMVMFPQMASLAQASGLLAFLAVTVVFYSISTITNAVLQSIGRMQMPLVSAAAALAVQTIVLEILLRAGNAGVYALVIVSILYAGIIFILNNRFLSRYIGLKHDTGIVFIRPAICAAIMGADARLVYEALAMALGRILDRPYFVNFFALIPSLLIAVVLYFFLMVRSGTMSQQDILQLPKGAKIAAVMHKLQWL